MSRNVSGKSYASTETWRLFVALPLPDAVREQVAGVQATLRPHGWRVKWVNPDLAHLTLKFLGESPPGRVPAIEKVLENLVERHPAVHVRTDAIGVFPSLARPRVIWLGLDGDLSPLGALAADVDRALARLRFRREYRPFQPHITLGRLRWGENPLRDFDRATREIDVPALDVTFDRVQLVRSVLGHGGPSYTTLAELALQPVAADRIELVEHG